MSKKIVNNTFYFIYWLYRNSTVFILLYNILCIRIINYNNTYLHFRKPRSVLENAYYRIRTKQCTKLLDFILTLTHTKNKFQRFFYIP